MENSFFKSFDGAEIFYRCFQHKPNQKTIVVIHRGHEHSERLREFSSNEKFKNFNIFAYDLRGHGNTKTPTSSVFMDYVRDLDSFIKYIKTQYNISVQDVFIVANSIGAVISTAWIHDFAPNIAGTALLAPAFDIKLYIPYAKQLTLLLTKLKKNAAVKSYVKSSMLSHIELEQKRYDGDPLINKEINARLLVDVLDAGKRIVDDASAINTPIIIFSAGKDYVVHNKAQKQFFVTIESELKEFIELKDSYHGIIFDQDRELVIDKIEQFMTKCFSVPKQENSIQPRKFSLREHESMVLKMLSLSQKISFCTQKTLLNKIGHLSKGMSIGLKYGFDSGLSLDYVYKNKPSGKIVFGKMLDNNYLNQPGWRGIRQRKIHLLQLIRSKITSLGNRPVTILDIAGGVGNYLFDIKKEYPQTEIVINEFKKENIVAGEKTIAENNFTGIRFTNFDCFDPQTYAKFNVTPDIVIISGIFELFPENATIQNAVNGVAEIMSKSGCVIYTGQPWHPQLYQIAFVLNNHRERSWVMRRRSQQELDSVFAHYGLLKKQMLIDNSGIFTVSLAEKGI